jgi:hypothetical protein
MGSEAGDKPAVRIGMSLQSSCCFPVLQWLNKPNNLAKKMQFLRYLTEVLFVDESHPLYPIVYYTGVTHRPPRMVMATYLSDVHRITGYVPLPIPGKFIGYRVYVLVQQADELLLAKQVDEGGRYAFTASAYITPDDGSIIEIVYSRLRKLYLTTINEANTTVYERHLFNPAQMVRWGRAVPFESICYVVTLTLKPGVVVCPNPDLVSELTRVPVGLLYGNSWRAPVLNETTAIQDQLVFVAHYQTLFSVGRNYALYFPFDRDASGHLFLDSLTGHARNLNPCFLSRDIDVCVPLFQSASDAFEAYVRYVVPYEEQQQRALEGGGPMETDEAWLDWYMEVDAVHDLENDSDLDWSEEDDDWRLLD